MKQQDDSLRIFNMVTNKGAIVDLQHSLDGTEGN
jgi:hypothetical protein